MAQLKELRQIIGKIVEGTATEEERDKLSQDDIRYLIHCEKIIVEADIPPGFKTKGNQQEFRLELVAKEHRESTFVFLIRISELAPENFSVILLYMIENKSVILFRCNGPHNFYHRENSLHSMAHTHELDIKDLRLGSFKHPNIKSAANYLDIHGAVRCYNRKVRILNLDKHLPPTINPTGQISLEDIDYDRP